MKTSFLFSTLLLVSWHHATNTHEQQNTTYKYAKNIAAAYGTHFALMATHHLGHILATQVAISNDALIKTQNPRFDFKPIHYGLQIVSTVPTFESTNVNVAVELSGPILGIIAACCLVKLWDHCQKNETKKTLTERILSDFKNTESDTLPAVPIIAVAHIILNAGSLLPIKHDAFDGYRIAKNLGWLK